MFEIEDREVQYPNRVQLVQVPGTIDQFDIIPVPGVIKKVGTPLNKETLDAIINNTYVGLDKYISVESTKKPGPVTDFTGIVPLTANSNDDVEVFYSSTHSSYKAWSAFDGDESSHWRPSTTVAPQYLGIYFKNQVLVKPEIFNIRCGYIQAATIQGSNDNENWTDISAEFGNLTSVTGDLVIESTAVDFYKYIRVNITQKRSGSENMRIFEFNFTGTQVRCYNSLEVVAVGFIEQINQRIMLDVSNIDNEVDTYLKVNDLGEKLTDIIADGKVELVYNGVSWDTYFSVNKLNEELTAIKNAIVALGGTV